MWDLLAPYSQQSVGIQKWQAFKLVRNGASSRLPIISATKQPFRGRQLVESVSKVKAADERQRNEERHKQQAAYYQRNEAAMHERRLV